jgi:cytochrome c553
MDTVQTGIKCNVDTVYFENYILPIISASCAYTGCHNAATAADGVKLDNYANIIKTGKIKAFNPGGSELYKVIVATNSKDVMPPPPAARLTAEQISMISKWISQGAKNNKCTENAGDCKTENISFSTYIKPVLASCTSCHKTGNAGGGINLDSYQGVKVAALSGRLYGSIAWSQGYLAMPQGGSKLGDCTIKKIKSWIDAGAPNN